MAINKLDARNSADKHVSDPVSAVLQRRIEDALLELQAVEDVNLVLDADGRLESVDIVARSSKSPKFVVRDVEAMLRARFGIDIDHRKIGVAALEHRSGADVSKILNEAATKASRDKSSYVEKLEAARGDDVFKYVLLVNLTALEGYVAQTRLQAEQSFKLTRIVAIVGFAFLGLGVVLGFASTFFGTANFSTALLAVGAGALTEFISGVFFYLYNRTLSQINRFHDRLVSMQSASMSVLALGQVRDPSRSDEAKVDLAKQLMSAAAVGGRPSLHVVASEDRTTNSE